MSTMTQLGTRLRPRAISLAYRAERGLTAVLSRAAVRRGWTPAVLPYAGYAGPEQARVLARVVLSPEAVEPSRQRGVSGWRRLLTLECPGATVEIELAGHRQSATSDSAGIVDARLDVVVPAGRAHATVRAAGREPVRTDVYVAAPEAGTGDICDIDDTAWVTGLRHPVRAAWRTLAGSSADRHAVPGMAALLRSLVEGEDQPAVVYLSNGPWNLAGPVSRFLERETFPPGVLLMTDWGLRPDRWFRDGKAHKAGSLRRLAADFPWVRWVLVGDNGEHDPDIYADFAREKPDHVVAIALREVGAGPGDGEREPETVGEIPLFRAPDGERLRALIQNSTVAGPSVVSQGSVPGRPAT